MRCLALGQALHAQSAEVLFICREYPGHLCSLIEQRGFPVKRLLASPGDRQPDWQADAAETRSAINGSRNRKADWLVVDNYFFDWRWEGAIRTATGRLLAIDDLSDRRHDCDLLLDQNLVADMRERYRNLVPDACLQLIGPKYALLQPEYASLRTRLKLREGVIRRVLIFLGAVDSANVTARVIDAFISLERPDIQVDVVLGASNRQSDSIRLKAEGHTNIKVHPWLASLAPLMAEADLAIGAGGATHWERMCLGLPCLVVTLSHNQRAISKELDRLGYIRLLGHHDEVTCGPIAQALEELIEQPLSEQWSQRCMALLDGRGANIVATAMTLTDSTPLRIRSATAKDESLLLDWANDPVTRENAFSTTAIPEQVHSRWLHDVLGAPSRHRLYVLETVQGIELGQVRFDAAGELWEIDYSVAPEFRRRGLGLRLLEAALPRFADDVRSAHVSALVKYGNIASRKVFDCLGFDARNEWHQGHEIIRYSKSLQAVH